MDTPDKPGTRPGCRFRQAPETQPAIVLMRLIVWCTTATPAAKMLYMPATAERQPGV